MVPNQKVTIYWSSATSEYYKSKGYKFTKRSAPFECDIDDLLPSCQHHVLAICDYCGKEFMTPYCAHYKRYLVGTKDACKNCKVRKEHNTLAPKRIQSRYEKLQKVCKDNKYTLLSTPEDCYYSDSKIKYICPKHGIQEQSLCNLLNGHKCFYCSYEFDSDRFITQRYTIEEVDEIIRSYNNNIWIDKTEYVNTHQKLHIQCGSCGNIFEMSLTTYMRSKCHKCAKCKRAESSGEEKIRSFLEEHIIEFEMQKKFRDCRDKNVLPFDFYLPQMNTIIEFDGPYHYRPIHGDAEYLRNVMHDDIKTEYCNNHGIQIIRIPYWEFTKIKDVLKEKLHIS